MRDWNWLKALNKIKNVALWIVIGLLFIALFNLLQPSSSRGPQSTLVFSDFVTDVNRGQVADVTVQGNSLTGHLTTGQSFATYTPTDPGLVNRLIEKGVRITALPPDDAPSLVGLIVYWFPVLVWIGIWLVLRRMDVMMGREWLAQSRDLAARVAVLENYRSSAADDRKDGKEAHLPETVEHGEE